MTDAVAGLLEGVKELQVHPDVPDGLRVLADAGVRVVTLTNGPLPQSATLLERAGLDGLVERRLSVNDAGRWKPHPDAYRYAADSCGVPLQRCARVAVHPWDRPGVGRCVSSWCTAHSGRASGIGIGIGTGSAANDTRFVAALAGPGIGRGPAGRSWCHSLRPARDGAGAHRAVPACARECRRLVRSGPRPRPNVTCAGEGHLT